MSFSDFCFLEEYLCLSLLKTARVFLSFGKIRRKRAIEMITVIIFSGVNGIHNSARYPDETAISQYNLKYVPSARHTYDHPFVINQAIPKQRRKCGLKMKRKITAKSRFIRSLLILIFCLNKKAYGSEAVITRNHG